MSLTDSALVIFWLILAAIIGLIGLLFYFISLDLMRKKTWAPRILNSVFLEVSTQKEHTDSDQEPQKEPKDMIGIAEQFFATIGQIEGRNLQHFLGINEYVSFEIAAHQKRISFYINVPKRLQALIEKQLHAQYPKAQIDVIKPYNIFKPQSFVAAAELTLQKDYAFPFRTYKNMEADPLNALTNSLSKLTNEEGAGIQLLISPISERWQHKPRSQALKIQQGRNPDVVTSSLALRALNGFSHLIGSAFNELLSGKNKPQAVPGHIDQSGIYKPLQLTPMQQEMIKKFEEKASKVGYKFNLRVISSSIDQATADGNLRNILASFMQYSMPPFNGFKVLRRQARQVVTDYVFRVFRNTKSILNTEELASLWHLPTPYIETPNIKWLIAKKAPSPVNTPNTGVLLGKNVYRNVETKIYLARDDRRRHQYIIGRT